MKYKQTFEDKCFSVFSYAFVIFVVVVTLYPMIYVFSMSISDPVSVTRGEVFFLPKGFSLKAFKTVVNNPELWRYYYNTIWYTVVGTVLNVIVTSLAAYPLSRRTFRPRKFFTIFYTITMFFGGGLIPTYIVVTRYLSLYNSRWAVILPTLTAVWYIIIARSFFENLPEELFECARLEGASEYRILAQIVVPLSKPVLAVLALYNGVAHWNSYFEAMIYLGKQELHPIQIYLRRVVIQASPEAMANMDASALGDGILAMMQVKYAVIVVAVLPIIMIYPFLQRFFVKGLLVGGVKG